MTDEPSAPAPGKIHLKRREAPPPQAPPAERRPVRGGPPGIVRAVLWLALVAWLLFLGYQLLDPGPMLYPDEQAGNSAWWRTLLPQTGEPSDLPVAEPDEPELRELKLQVADALVAGRFVAAMQQIRNHQDVPGSYPYQDKLSELARFVADVSRVNNVVCDALSRKLDEEVVIRIKGRSCKIVVRAVAGHRINAMLLPDKPGTEPRSVTFAVTDMDPIERAHWIGRADTPVACAMKYVLLMRGGDPEGARVFARGCGIMAEACAARTTAGSGIDPQTS